MVDDPIKYHWSSHRAYMMLEEFTWLAKDKALIEFGESRIDATQNFHKFVMDGIGLEEDSVFEVGCTDGILGDEEFIENIKDNFDKSGDKELVVTDLDTLLDIVSDWYEIEIDELQKPGMNRRISHIRSITALLARDYEGITLRELADFCGREASGMSKAAMRLESRIRTSLPLKKEVENLKNSIDQLLSG